MFQILSTCAIKPPSSRASFIRPSSKTDKSHSASGIVHESFIIPSSAFKCPEPGSRKARRLRARFAKLVCGNEREPYIYARAIMIWSFLRQMCTWLPALHPSSLPAFLPSCLPFVAMHNSERLVEDYDEPTIFSPRIHRRELRIRQSEF